MKIAIIFIGTNQYFNFFSDYYMSAKVNFLKDTEKHFFVFTDSEHIFFEKDITKISIKHEKWPFITLHRFKFINKIKNLLEDYDLIAYIDADMIIESQIEEKEFFSVLENKNLFGVQHPLYINRIGTFETNLNSRASVVKEDDISTYWQGCFWGGRKEKFLQLCEELESRVNEDLTNNVIALWHDESHLNKYFIENKKDVATFDPGYACPSNWYNVFNRKIIHLVKDNSSLHV